MHGGEVSMHSGYSPYNIMRAFVYSLRPRHNGRHFQTTFLNVLSWMTMYKFRLKFHWSLIPRVQLTIFQQWFRYWLGAVQATSHYLSQWWLVYRRIYASLGLNESRSLLRLTLLWSYSVGSKPWFLSPLPLWFRLPYIYLLPYSKNNIFGNSYYTLFDTAMTI